MPIVLMRTTIPIHAHDRARARAHALSRIRYDNASAGHDAAGQIIHHRVAFPISQAHAWVYSEHVPPSLQQYGHRYGL